MKYRPLRLGKLVEEELSLIISRELEFGGALPTITKIDVTDKSGRVKVWFSVFPSSESKKVLGILQNEKGKLRRLLMKKISIKTMPTLEFEIDHGVENAAVVEKILIGDH